MAEKRVTLGPLAANVAASIRRIRTQRRMTYTEMVKRLTDIGHPLPILALRRIERGERRVDVDELVAIARVLDAEPWNLTEPARCDACLGSPPPGYRCLSCGKERQ
ncbi:helix-turn-helix domain-containing protein [Micromonospora sp. Mcm103]|uniref:helix-turn-helix domain-containing protein n=1 Tax=Micromonospora sp. Mcm103 TaxID=2926015 RepID=UPI0021C9A44C|nr:helix-turn-helix transcriptional regulator [Micromonospora sp. Mcm103]